VDRAVMMLIRFEELRALVYEGGCDDVRRYAKTLSAGAREPGDGRLR
jgi:hypothetical protein